MTRDYDYFREIQGVVDEIYLGKVQEYQLMQQIWEEEHRVIKPFLGKKKPRYKNRHHETTIELGDVLPF